MLTNQRNKRVKLIWEINETDVNKVNEFVGRFQNEFVLSRISRNVDRINIRLDKDAILKALIMCLLTSKQRSGPNSPVGLFLKKEPFPISADSLKDQTNLQTYIWDTLNKNNLNRYINKVSRFFTTNYRTLLGNNWEIISNLEELHNEQSSKEVERHMADKLQDTFIGFGPKQSRNFLQVLGLTKFEIPIDSRITNWLNNFGFPITLSSTALQDRAYYQLVSDAFQLLCEKAGIYPCILDAAIFSSVDKNEWIEGNIIY